MNIYKELDAVCCNEHHRNRYIKIIDAFVNTPVDDGEMHHILPRALFPDRINDPNNIVRLPYRVHFLVHWILAKATANYSMMSAFNAMCNKNDHKMKRSILYEYGKKMFKQSQTGELNIGYGVISAWNKIDNKMERVSRQLFDSNRNIYGGITCKEALAWKAIHEGYTPRKQTETQKLAASKATKGSTPAVCVLTGASLGRIRLDDPRWKDGIIKSTSKGKTYPEEVRKKMGRKKSTTRNGHQLSLLL